MQSILAHRRWMAWGFIIGVIAGPVLLAGGWLWLYLHLENSGRGIHDNLAGFINLVLIVGGAVGGGLLGRFVGARLAARRPRR